MGHGIRSPRRAVYGMHCARADVRTPHDPAFVRARALFGAFSSTQPTVGTQEAVQMRADEAGVSEPPSGISAASWASSRDSWASRDVVCEHDVHCRWTSMCSVPHDLRMEEQMRYELLIRTVHICTRIMRAGTTRSAGHSARHES